jgi:hypothetical protein
MKFFGEENRLSVMELVLKQNHGINKFNKEFKA